MLKIYFKYQCWERFSTQPSCLKSIRCMRSRELTDCHDWPGFMSQCFLSVDLVPVWKCPLQSPHWQWCNLRLHFLLPQADFFFSLPAAMRLLKKKLKIYTKCWNWFFSFFFLPVLNLDWKAFYSWIQLQQKYQISFQREWKANIVSPRPLDVWNFILRVCMGGVVYMTSYPWGKV